jgi:hypothetical protein
VDALSFLGSVLFALVLLGLLLDVGSRERGSGTGSSVHVRAHADGKVTQDPSSDTSPPLYPVLLALGLVACLLMLS